MSGLDGERYQNAYCEWHSLMIINIVAVLFTFSVSPVVIFFPLYNRTCLLRLSCIVVCRYNYTFYYYIILYCYVTLRY